jgi:hypothetical protein
MHRLRAMAGDDMHRLRHVFLHGNKLPDRVPLAGQYEGLITLAGGWPDGVPDNKKSSGLPAGGYFLIDSLGNLVMHFRPDVEPGVVAPP